MPFPRTGHENARAPDSGHSRPRGPGSVQAHSGPHLRGGLPTGSFGYRPKRTAHAAVHPVADAIVRYKPPVIDLDLRAYFDNVRHHRLLQKVALRVSRINDLEMVALTVTIGTSVTRWLRRLDKLRRRLQQPFGVRGVYERMS